MAGRVTSCRLSLDTSLLLRITMHLHSVLSLYAVLEEWWEYPDSVLEERL